MPTLQEFKGNCWKPGSVPKSDSEGTEQREYGGSYSDSL